jgi:hypothetical protein
VKRICFVYNSTRKKYFWIETWIADQLVDYKKLRIIMSKVSDSWGRHESAAAGMFYNGDDDVRLYDSDEDHVYGMRLCPLTAPTTGLFIYPPRDIWMWRAKVELYRQNSSFAYQSSMKILPAESSSREAGGADEGNEELCLMKCIFYTWKWCLTCRKILRHGAEGFTSPPKESVL